MRHLLRPLLFLPVLALAACEGATVPETPLLVTDRAEYALERTGDLYQARIGFTFHNRTGADVMLVGCLRPDPPSMEKRAGDAWVLAYVPAVPLCIARPVRVRRGETLASALPFVATAPEGTAADELPGEYRLVWEIYRAGRDEDDGGPLLPREHRVSNPFRLTL